MPEGRVKWFNDQKGYGFLESEVNAGDIFVHYSSIVADGFRTLEEGAQVSFELQEGPKGVQAVNVRMMVE